MPIYINATARYLLKYSPLFDADWYLDQNPDVSKAKINPLHHYFSCGAKESRNPHPLFQNDWYLRQNPDISDSDINPLAHYFFFGERESRCPNSFFDLRWYAEKYPDTHHQKGLLADYITRSLSSERRIPSPAFDSEWYAWRYEQDIPKNADPLAYYLSFGFKRGHNPRPKSRRFGGIQIWGQPKDASGVLLRMSNATEPPAIIIPVHNAFNAVKDCLHSILRNTRGQNCRIIIINDASTDPETVGLLKEFEQQYAHFEIYHNKQNLGYTRTINIGIRMAKKSDVVLLNSDTEVTPGWLRRLRIAAYSEERTGTVTPLSNHAGAFSAPLPYQENILPPYLSQDEYSRAISQGSFRTYLKAPTGNGFCLYIRRDCLEETGLFDEVAFPRGYGEENDFCLRATSLGWNHVIDDSTFVFHKRNASFYNEKDALLKNATNMMNKRYPSYTSAVQTFFNGSAIRTVRERTNGFALAQHPNSKRLLPRILYVIASISGGTPNTNKDLMGALADRIETFLLVSDGQNLKLFLYEDKRLIPLETRTLNRSLELFPHDSDEYNNEVASWLIRYDIELVHIRHIAWHGLELISVCKHLQLPVVFSFHDYYTVCPTIKLLDENNHFCGGVCTTSKGECTVQLWEPSPLWPPLKHHAVHTWKKQFAKMLTQCDLFITTHEVPKKILTDNYPFLSERPFHVIPHGRDFKEFLSLNAPILKDEPLRLVIPGNISKSKGLDILIDIGNATSKKDLEIHIMGTFGVTENLPDNIILHGRYERQDFSKILTEIRPHLGGVFSIWSETHCHVLTELWACGIPVIGFDFGAVGSRLRKSGAGWVMEQASTENILKLMNQLRKHPEELEQKSQAIQKWQKTSGVSQNTLSMGNAYYDLYRTLLPGATEKQLQVKRTSVALIVPTATLYRGAILGRGSSHVRFFEKTHDALHRNIRYDALTSETSPEIITEKYDMILVQRATLDAFSAAELIRLAKKKKRPLIVDLDDDLFELSITKPETLSREYCELVLKPLLVAADLVMFSTAILYQRYQSLIKKGVLFKNTINEKLWLSPLKTNAHDFFMRKKTEQDIHIVYMGTETHERDLLLLKDAILSARKQFNGIRLFTIGITEQNFDWHESIPIPRKLRPYPLFVPWLRNILADMDLAVAPLENTRFNQGKSDLKFLEYSAAHLPSICSDVIPYTNSVRHGATGLLAANTSTDWTEQILYACHNPEEMKRMVNNAHEEVLKHHLMRGDEEKLDLIIRELINP